jgi:predicted nucleotidyltransferase
MITSIFDKELNKIQFNLEDKINLEKLCKFYQIKKLSFFGSVLRNDFTDKSDIDLLVEFEEGHQIGLEFISIEDKLTELFKRKADLNCPDMLHKYFKDKVIQESKAIYVKS